MTAPTPGAAQAEPPAFTSGRGARQVYLAGRTSDWLRVDGENLAAGVVENILLRHPAVSQAAVYGIPAPDVGDDLVAALVLRDAGARGDGDVRGDGDALRGGDAPDGGGAPRVRHAQRARDVLSPGSFEEFLAAQPDLSPKAWPRYVRIADELPTTATNKVLKRELVREGTDFDDPCWIRDERGRSYTPRSRVR